MVGQRNQTVLAGRGAVAAWGLGWWAERTRQRELAEAHAQLARDVRWQWRSVCAATPLSQMIYTPSGPTRAVPLIEHVELGPPISLMVKMRSGQQLADFVAAAPTIAPALGAVALEVTPLASPWIRVVLLQAPVVALPNRSSESDVEPRKARA